MKLADNPSRSCPWVSRTRYLCLVGCVLAGVVPAHAQQPTISGALNAASYSTSIAPGSLVAIFGSGLASSQASASSVPLPPQLAGTAVQIGGRSAPLYYVSPQQINFQAPFEIAAGTVPLVVTAPGGQSSVLQLVISPMAPGLFTLASNGLGRALVFNPSFQLATTPKSGDTIILYATGLGATNPPAPTGAGGVSSEPLNRAVVTPVVNIGGRNANVLFAGMAPGFVGVYQLNVVVPAGIETDTINISSGTATSSVLSAGLQIVSMVPTCAAGPILLGDVNGDGVVTQEDANQILAWLAGTIAALGCPANADANQDGLITSADANAISQRVAGTSRGLSVALAGVYS